MDRRCARWPRPSWSLLLAGRGCAPACSSAMPTMVSSRRSGPISGAWHRRTCPGERPRALSGPRPERSRARGRKRELTAKSSSRWAGAITRYSADAYGLAKRNLVTERKSLMARVAKIKGRVSLAPGETKGKRHGCGSAAERFERQMRRQARSARLAVVEA